MSEVKIDYDLISKNLNEDDFVVSDENFKLPDMGEYYMNAVDNPYAELVDEATSGGASKDKDKSSFYVDPPYFKHLGSYLNHGVYFLKGKPDFTERSRFINRNDGDTLYIPFDTLDDGGSGVLEELRASIRNASHKALNSKLNPDETPVELAVRSLGIDAPEIPHYSLEWIDPKRVRTDTKPFGEVYGKKNYVVENDPARSPDQEVKLIQIDGVWREYVEADMPLDGDHDSTYEANKAAGKERIRLLISDQSNPATREIGEKINEKLYDLIVNQANGEVYIMLDRTSLNRSNEKYPTKYGSDVWGSGIMNDLRMFFDQVTDYNQYRYAGYNMWGQDNHGRFLGTPYVKLRNENGEYWVNIPKYLIANFPEAIEVLPVYNDSPLHQDNHNFASRVFNLGSYDYHNRVLADVFGEATETFDDRKNIQQSLHGKNYEALKEWTVMIGDCMFFVPPTSIRVVTQTTNERLPVVRAKGSIIKGALKAERTIELTLYFNEERGINGELYETKLPNGEKITYHMNGLRALVSQFKFTPFLPIENYFINQVLGIEAVSLVGLQTSTMPDYPKCIAATLTVQEFDYRQYLPELPLYYDEDYNLTKNAFGSIINFELFRWYYQQAILKGESLKDVHVNSMEYLKETHGQKTALLPMKFTDPYLKIYIANQNHLDKMLQVKLEKMRRSDATIDISDTEKLLAKDLAQVYRSLAGLVEDQRFLDLLDDLNERDDRVGEVIAAAPSYRNDSAPNFTVTRQIHGEDGYWETAVSKEEMGQRFTAFMKYVEAAIIESNSAMEQTALVNPRLTFYTEKIATKLINPYSNYPQLAEGRHDDGGDPTKAVTKDGRVIFGVTFDVQADYVLNDEALDELRRDCSAATQLLMEDIFPKKQIFIPFHGEFWTDENRPSMPWIMDQEIMNFRLDVNHPDLQFIAYCNDVASHLDVNDGDTQNQEVDQLKQAADLDLMDTLIYDEYPLENVKIKNIACAIGNVFNRLGTNGSDGYAPQYMGGQDTYFEISLETQDLNTIKLLAGLPRLTTHYAREYRLVIPASPLKIETELSKLMGINEVVIETIDIQSVPNQPGLYQINMRMISMDRTLRNREALQKINEFYVTGSLADDNREQIRTRNYFELHAALSEAEVYPDLELPTIDELRLAGFDFVRYTFNDDRKYPDPDFYFMYPHTLTCEVWREAVDEMQNAAMDEYTWVDSVGGEIKTKSSTEMGIDIVESNDVADQEREVYETAKNFAKQENTPEPDTLSSKFDVINKLRSSQASQAWDISKDIKVMFLEEPYADLLKGHMDAKNAGTESGGEWMYEAMAKAREASKAIESYLAEFDDPGVSSGNLPTEGKIEDWVDDFFDDERVENIFTLLEVSEYKKLRKIAKQLIFAAACAATSDMEYQKGAKKATWHPKSNFYALKTTSGQDDSGITPTSNIDEIRDYGVEFGPYRTRMYTSKEIEEIEGSFETPAISGSGSGFNKTHFLLDPYFRRDGVTMEEIESYKVGCATDAKYATYAFIRLVLYMLKHLIDDRLLPNVTLDVMRQEFATQLKDEKAGIFDGITREEQKQIESYLEFVKSGGKAMDNGKLFAAVVLALTDKDIKYYEVMKRREYQMLNNMLQSTVSYEGVFNPADRSGIFFRKYLLALVGLDVIEKDYHIGQSIQNPVTDFKKILNEKKYIQAAEDPYTYIKHSFYDMVVNDKRGRMARAFPTFYILFVDEGREIGLWKLHDNFYNINSVAEIQIAKSRKNPADTARIVMSNFFHTYTTEDEDMNTNYRYDFRDVWNSIFNSRATYLQQEARRMRQQPLNRARITPGTRVHIRMGYSSNASTLPVVFNGKIAEVSTGEAVEIIAQGDGVELMNPILDNTEAHEMQNRDNNPISRFVKNLFDSGATPKVILDSLLTTKGGWIRKVVRNISNGYFNSEHPFGITHFGDPEYKVIFKNGEPTQNIFEAISKPKWGDLGSELNEEYNMKEAPKLTTEIYGKTFWDILNFVTSVSPDFICGIAPFGLRSTIFHGAPRYYYAYDYYKSPEGVILERRKPYQQYHIYTSYTDIIKNDIRASDRDIKTNAVGIYTRKNALGRKSQEKVGPLWVDWDIYPEFQKSIVLDTQLYSKGIPALGTVVPFLNSIVDNAADDKGTVQGMKQIAWRMTVSALKDAMKEMYKGELIVVGDPSVKPHDRIYIHDIYENMNGSCLVEGVVHNFSANSGFTTTLYPDLIAVHDDRHEMAIQSTVGNVVAKGAIVHGSLIGISTLLGAKPGVAPVLNAIKWSVGKGQSLKAVGYAKGAVSAIKNSGLWTKIMASSATKAASAGKIAGAVAKVGGALGKAGAAVGTAAGAITSSPLLMGIVMVAAEIAIVYTISKLVTSAIERWMASRQVLQVFPLKKNSKVYTAGMQGSKGVIYGSPSYNQLGTFDKLFAKIADTENMNPLMKAASWLFLTDDMQNIAGRYKRIEENVEEMGTDIAEVKTTDSLLRGLVQSQNNKLNNYKKHLLTPRADVTDSEARTRAVDKYGILDSNAIEINQRITNENIYILNDQRIKKAMDQGIFEVIYNTPMDGHMFGTKELLIGGVPTQVNAITGEKNGIKTYDIPFLKEEALDILCHIIAKASEKIPDFEPEVHDDKPMNLILLTSALRVGEESMASTGYTFIIDAQGETINNSVLREVISSLDSEVKALGDKYNITAKSMFAYANTSKGGIAVSVMPPG